MSSGAEPVGGDGIGAFALGPGEPPAGPWTARPVADLARELLELARARRAGQVGRVAGPVVIAVDGRSAGGKTTLAGRVADAVGRSAVVHADDLAWHEPMFGWAHVERALLEAVRAGGPVRLRPPAWAERGREGAIELPEDLELVVIEGVGSAQREVADLLDAVVWVQSDDAEAERRGIARDIASGENGDVEETIAFWHAWMAHEREHLRADRPWERADVVAAGTPPIPLADGEVAVAPPLRPPHPALPPQP